MSENDAATPAPPELCACSEPPREMESPAAAALLSLPPPSGEASTPRDEEDEAAAKGTPPIWGGLPPPLPSSPCLSLGEVGISMLENRLRLPSLPLMRGALVET